MASPLWELEQELTVGGIRMRISNDFGSLVFAPALDVELLRSIHVVDAISQSVFVPT